MKYNEEKGDLFELIGTHHLVHCISADHRMGQGIAIDFNKLYRLERSFRAYTRGGGKLELGKVYMVGKSLSLVTKQSYWHKPTYESLQGSLDDLKKFCEESEIKKLAMPKIGCGLDRLQWGKVSEMIKETFKDVDIEIEVRYL